jgi:hypothetical protein
VTRAGRPEARPDSPVEADRVAPPAAVVAPAVPRVGSSLRAAAGRAAHPVGSNLRAVLRAAAGRGAEAPAVAGTG